MPSFARASRRLTLQSASWLNMIEIEFSALARQCLHRRIATLETLRTEVLSLIQECMAKQIKVDWQFSLTKARTKFSSHYERAIKPEHN